MKTNNLIYLGLGALIAYLIFKPKGASATSTSPSPDPAPMPMPPSPAPIPPYKFKEGNQYTLTLEKDFYQGMAAKPIFKKGDKLTGTWMTVPLSLTNDHVQAIPVLQVIKVVGGVVGLMQYRIPANWFKEYNMEY